MLVYKIKKMEAIKKISKTLKFYKAHLSGQFGIFLLFRTMAVAWEEVEGNAPPAKFAPRTGAENGSVLPPSDILL